MATERIEAMGGVETMCHRRGGLPHCHEGPRWPRHRPGPRVHARTRSSGRCEGERACLDVELNACTVIPVPPDNTKPPRNLFEPPPLGARVIMTAIEEIARAQELECPRVAYKKNDRNEHVVALIFAGWRRSAE